MTRRGRRCCCFFSQLNLCCYNQPFLWLHYKNCFYTIILLPSSYLRIINICTRIYFKALRLSFLMDGDGLAHGEESAWLPRGYGVAGPWVPLPSVHITLYLFVVFPITQPQPFYQLYRVSQSMLWFFFWSKIPQLLFEFSETSRRI